jgi:hypothetical protein
MLYGAEYTVNNCRGNFELKTKIGVMKRLEKQGVIKLIYTGYSWLCESVNNSQFVIYCRTGEDKYNRSNYSKLEGNTKASFEFWN